MKDGARLIWILYLRLFVIMPFYLKLNAQGYGYVSMRRNNCSFMKNTPKYTLMSLSALGQGGLGCLSLHCFSCLAALDKKNCQKEQQWCALTGIQKHLITTSITGEYCRLAGSEHCSFRLRYECQCRRQIPCRGQCVRSPKPCASRPWSCRTTARPDSLSLSPQQRWRSVWGPRDEHSNNTARVSHLQNITESAKSLVDKLKYQLLL